MEKLSREEAFERIAQIIGCKWSVRILETLREEGNVRPSELLRKYRGLAARVLHRCLNRLEKDDLISKEVFAEIPPHTEYRLTDQGQHFLALLEAAHSLAAEWRGSQKVVRLSS